MMAQARKRGAPASETAVDEPPAPALTDPDPSAARRRKLPTLFSWALRLSVGLVLSLAAVMFVDAAERYLTGDD